MKVHLIVPMAGLGSRFSKAGYKVPKPLLDVHDSHMYQVVLGNLFDANLGSIRIVSPKEFGLPNHFDALGGSLDGVPVVITELNHVTDGPATTVELALAGIPDQDAVVVANSDQYLDFNCAKFYQRLLETPTGGVIVTMEDTDPKWSFVLTNKNDLVVGVKEKHPVSHIATAGVYGFRSASELKTAIRHMRAADDRTNGELYVGPAYNHLKGYPSGLAEIEHLGPVGQVMHGMGIPQDYEDFLKLDKSVQAALKSKLLFRR